MFSEEIYGNLRLDSGIEAHIFAQLFFLLVVAFNFESACRKCFM